MPFVARLLQSAAAVACALALGCAHAADGTLRLDYAAQAPATVVAKHFGWVEQAVPGVQVQWLREAGLVALKQGQVDFALAESGAALTARAGGAPVKAVYVYAHPAPASYGLVAVPESLLATRAGEAAQVIAAYERARQWIIAHPREAAQVLAQETGTTVAIAQEQLARADLTVSRPGPAQAQALKAAAGADAQAAAATLLDDGPIRAALLRGREPGESRLALGL